MAYKVKTPFGLFFVLLSAAAVNVELMPTLSAAPIAAQAIADHFSSVRSMSGDFVQSGPKGEKTSGRFFLKRPGKIRFNFASQSGVTVIADGKSVFVYNKKLKTSRLYSLSKTPLKFLLDNKVNFSGGRLKSIKEEGDLIIINLVDNSAYGSSSISMMFDRKSLDLRKWSLTDEKGLTTTVSIFNVKLDVPLAEGTFTIDYAANREYNTAKSR